MDKATFLGAGRPSSTLEIQGFGNVHLRRITVGEHDQFVSMCTDATKEGKMDSARLQAARLYLVSCTLTDEHGTRLFSAGDKELLGADPVAVEAIFQEAQRINGLDRTTEKKT